MSAITSSTSRTRSSAARLNMKLGNQAVREAKQRLIDAHKDEYATYLRQQRVNLGLPPEAESRNVTLTEAEKQQRAAQRKRERLEAKMAKLRQELEAVSAVTAS